MIVSALEQRSRHGIDAELGSIARRPHRAAVAVFGLASVTTAGEFRCLIGIPSISILMWD